MQSFESDGVRIAYSDEGEGEPVLLIHGFASNVATNWIGPGWVQTLTGSGRRVIAYDNRGHGLSEKLYDPSRYGAPAMAEDARRLLDHLGIARADVMGYSMGARIAAFLAVDHPGAVRSAILGGLGIRLVDGVGLPTSIADALEAPTLLDVPDRPAVVVEFVVTPQVLFGVVPPDVGRHPGNIGRSVRAAPGAGRRPPSRCRRGSRTPGRRCRCCRRSWRSRR